MALNAQDVNFFHKIYPSLNFDFVQEIVEKFQNWSSLGWLADTPICSERPAVWGPKYMSWQFFHKTDPFQFTFCTINCWKFLKLGQIGQIGRPLPPPPFICPKCPALWGPEYMSWHFVVEYRPPLNLLFLQKIVEKFPNWSILGWFADPYLSKIM